METRPTGLRVDLLAVLINLLATPETEMSASYYPDGLLSGKEFSKAP